MPRKELAEILDAVVTLNVRHQQISDLRNDRCQKTTYCKHNDFGIVVGKPITKHAKNYHAQNTENNAADASLNRLFGRYVGNELMLSAATEEHSAKVSKNVGYPRANKDSKIEDVSTHLVIVQNDDSVKSHQDVERSCKKHTNICKIIFAVRKNGYCKEIKQRNEQLSYWICEFRNMIYLIIRF